MNARMDDLTNAPVADDVSTLAWVHGELRKSLETAHKALRRYLKEAEAVGNSDVDAVDPAVLRTARVQIHQGVGALELIGQTAAAQLLRAAEAAVQRMVQKPAIVDVAAVDVIERASFALLDYLSRVIAGKNVSAVALFPQYRAAQTLAGADRVHPADLWVNEWRWEPLAADPAAMPRHADEATRGDMEALVLGLMRQPDRATLESISTVCAGLATGAGSPHEATLWQLAAAFFEAQSRGLISHDVYTKRVASRLLAYLRSALRGESDVPERLAQDLLFFCAHAKRPGARGDSPRLAAVRRAWQLGETPAVDYETPRLGRFDPAWIAQAKKRVGGARDAWSAVAGGELHRLSGLQEQFSLVGESLQRLFPSGDQLAQSLQAAVGQTVASGDAPAPQLAMEVATSILYLDASLEDAELDHPQLAQRVQRMARRIDEVRVGAEAQPLEPWMEELYRRVSDRQTMGSVVQELRASLSEVEKQIDQYFRDPHKRDLLIPVPGQLSSMRGVFSVLGLDHASQAVLHMRDDVDALAQTEVDPTRAAQNGTFDRLADNLGALSFLIDMLSVQPALAKSLFHYDPATGSLTAVMGQSERPSSFAGFENTQPPPLEDDDTPVTRTSVLGALDAVSPAPAPVTAPPPPPVAPPPAPRPAPSPAPAPAIASGLEDDAEMREIFIEEAREVIQEARASLARLADQPDDLGEMTAVRRAFHTLKGSSRMVGLRDYGEAAWACEQLYNTRLAATATIDEPLASLTAEVLDFMDGWTEAIAAGRDEGHASPPVVRAADALRLEGRRVAVGAPGAPVVAEPAPAPVAAPVAAPVFAAPAVAAPEPAPTIAFVPETPALPEVTQPPELPDLPLDDLPDTPTVTLPPEPVPVADTVAELPQAIELDLSEPLPPEVPPAPEVSFDLDLGELEAAAAEEAAALPSAQAIELELPDLDFGPLVAPPAPAETVEPAAVDIDAGEPVAMPAEAVAELPTDVEPAAEAVPAVDDQVKVIGDLRIGIPLFNIFLNEADEQSRRLTTELAEWAHEFERRPVAESSIALAHSLAGNSATVGHADLSTLARSLEHALERSHGFGRGREGEPELFAEAAEEVRRLLHQFAAGFLRPVSVEVLQRLADHERWPAPQPLPEVEPPIAFMPARESSFAALEDDDTVDAVDAIDDELFPIFEEEADELLPQLQARLREWASRPDDREAASACMRTLHTFKGGARLAGAMRVGELAHRLETSIEELLARDRAAVADIEPLLGRVDAIVGAFEALRHPGQAAGLPGLAPATAEPVVVVEPIAPLSAAAVADELAAAPTAAPVSDSGAAPIDWTRFAVTRPVVATGAERSTVASSAVVRVRGSLLDRLVNQAGEVSIARARIDSDVKQLQASLNELTDSLDRLRRQLRDIELQAETQLASRLEAAKQASANFDPLEMDRFTRFQELTRFMAESVNDVATLQRSLQRTLQSTEDELAAQARVTRELQDDLLRTRMIEFESLADRLYRVVRQASKDTAKQVRLDIVGGAIEIDRGVLERMTGPFEHLLRNSVVHGVETPDARGAAGKDKTGSITITVTQEGNEVAVEVRDDGAGLDLPRIRARAVERGLLAADAQPSEGELAQLIFAPGFSTAEQVTELAGRGVGMDVVRAEVDAMGGRIETATRPGQGTAFRLLLPLTTAVTQVVMLRCGELTVAVPSTLIEIVRRCRPDELERGYATGVFEVGEEPVQFFWLGALLQTGLRGTLTGGRSQPVVVIRSAAQRVALHVDEVVGNQEVVVKNVGPQLSRLPGLAGVTLLPSGQVALIYNPVALATLYGPGVQRQLQAEAVSTDEPMAVEPVAAAAPTLAPLVLVVDDSLTVRRVTQRLLVREGYRVALAKDGLEALERLAEERPTVLLSDIEMPRMDGFDLARNVRADARLAGLPIVMITSRTADKHREHAMTLGVDHYLGKPYSEDELLALVARYAGADVAH